MMKEYIRTKLTVTEFDAEDVITTSGEPTSVTTKRIEMYSPNYKSENSPTSFGWNWTLWQ